MKLWNSLVTCVLYCSATSTTTTTTTTEDITTLTTTTDNIMDKVSQSNRFFNIKVTIEIEPPCYLSRIVTFIISFRWTVKIFVSIIAQVGIVNVLDGMTSVIMDA